MDNASNCYKNDRKILLHPIFLLHESNVFRFDNILKLDAYVYGGAKKITLYSSSPYLVSLDLAKFMLK